jgi:Ras GTPase-activating-like protein IQGAP2/3
LGTSYLLISHANLRTPETFDIVSKTVHVAARKNLAQISKVLTQITTGYEFDDDSPIYVPINDYVRKAISEISVWMIEGNHDLDIILIRLTLTASIIVANVPDAETQFHAHEFLDATVQPKPIYISPNEIYTMHGLLSQFQDRLVCS